MQDQLSTQGYAVVRNALDQTTIDTLRDQAEQIANSFQQTENSRKAQLPHNAASPQPVFTTHNQAGALDQAFLRSAADIVCFAEPAAQPQTERQPRRSPPSQTQGTPPQPCSPHPTVNKIGHALHDFDPIFQAFSYGPIVQRLIDGLHLAEPILCQSMFMFKAPHTGGPVAPHQDATFLHTEPHSCIALWFALDDASPHNGCLHVWPGSHTRSPAVRFVRTQPNQTPATTFVDATTGNPLPQSESNNPTPQSKGIEAHPGRYQPVPAKAGDVIVMHGNLAHMSHPNRSNHPRRAYTLHVINGRAHYPRSNWLQRPPERPFRPFWEQAGQGESWRCNGTH